MRPPDPALHQHDLSPDAARSFVATAGLRREQQVLEVGAGTGELTAALLAAGARVEAIEIDGQRAVGLRQRFQSEIAADRLQLTVGDARLQHPLTRPGWRVVANPPFMHTAELCRRWLLEDLPGGPPAAIDLVVQWQVAQKFTAAGGRQTRMAILWASAGTARISKKLRRDEVTPPAHVPLAGFSWRRQPAAPAPAMLRRLDQLLAQGLAGPPNLRQALRGLATPAIIKKQASLHGYDPDDHPTALPASAWLPLADFLHGLGRLS